MYCSINDLRELLEEDSLLDLTDDEGDGSFVVSPTPNAAYKRILSAIKEADGIIDSYLCGRYETPLNSVPDIIVKVSAHLTICNLFQRRPKSRIPEDLTERRRGQINLLKDMQSGKAKLPGLIDNSVAPAGDYLCSKTKNDTMFDDATMGMM